MKICLAAQSDRKNLDWKKCKYILESFYYFKNWQLPYLKSCELFLIDSGAFTFMNSSKCINWNSYINDYANFINRYNIKYFFELDIDKIVGYENVLKMRNKLEKLTNKKCIPVWHRNRGLQDWIELTKTYNYVAIGGFAIKEIKPKEYIIINKLLEIAKNNNCKVHGLGFTNTNILHNFKFYSVDSTSWKSGSRFGQIHIFDGKRIIIKEYENKRVKTGKELDEHNFIEWIKFQRYAEIYL